MDNIQIGIGMLSDFSEQRIKGLVELRPWMKDKKFLLLTKREEISKFISVAISKKICAIDLETTSLNTRTDNKGNCYAKIVGVCLSHDINEGAYIPVAHEDADEYNVSLDFVIECIKELIRNCVLVFHNFKYDGEILRYNGIIIEDENKYEDTYLLAAVEDASRKEKGLKYLSEKLLNRQQIEFKDMTDYGHFSMVPPQLACYYGASDAMNTLALYYYLKESLDKQDPTMKEGPWFIYKIEKRCLFVTMEMERNHVLIDKEYVIKLKEEIDAKMNILKHNIYKLAGFDSDSDQEDAFDIDSTQQLGKILFEKLGISYPEDKGRTKLGNYQTNGEILEKLIDKHPIIELILAYRSYAKVKSTYLENWLKNADEKGEVKFQLNQVQTDTGRYSSTGGKGLKIDGYCGVNCQNIPVYDKNDKYAVNLRRAIIARPGYKIVSIDYSGEELRIATNFSKEKKWIDEFLQGSGDLHTVTAKIITGKDKVTKEERKLAKTLNFLTLYGGGPASFAQQAKIPIEDAKKIMTTFFKEYKGLNNWIKEECIRAKKRGYSKTALGRRRSLVEFYKSEDKVLQSKGDRCAINSAIQGTGADIIKIALWRVYKWIKENKLENEVRILLPIHDEILYEIKEDKLEVIIPEICEIMKLKDICKLLKWDVPLEVDAEYGDSFDVDHNFWEEYNKKEEMKSHENQMDLKTFEEEKRQEKTVQENKLLTIETVPQVSITSNVDINSMLQNIVVSERKVENIISSEGLINLKSYEDNANNYIDNKDFYNYVIDTTLLAAYKIKFIFDFIDSIDNFLIGTKKRICIVAKSGEVVHRTKKKYSVDAFITLCTLFNI